MLINTISTRARLNISRVDEVYFHRSTVIVTYTARDTYTRNPIDVRVDNTRSQKSSMRRESERKQWTKRAMSSHVNRQSPVVVRHGPVIITINETLKTFQTFKVVGPTPSCFAYFSECSIKVVLH